MKIVYIGELYISDSEFPLYKALIESGIDLDVYLPIRGNQFHVNLIDIDEVKKIDGVIDSTEYESFNRFRDYMNLDRIHLFNNYHNRRRDPRAWLAVLKLMWQIIKKKPDVIHFAWPQAGTLKLLYLLPVKKVLTVHDPIPHSSSDENNQKKEQIRKKAISSVDRYLMLSDVHKEAFCNRYNIEPAKISLSRFGYYNWMDCIAASGNSRDLPKKYVLFWGQIQTHKGVDVLLKAMVKVHDVLPDLHCIVAGRGDFGFDIGPYLKLDYIEIRHRFVKVAEVASLLKHCLFNVCPYKDATQSGVAQNAFSAGVPLIVTNVGNLPEMVSDGVTGLVVPPNDDDALAKAIIRLAQDAELLEMFKDNIKNVWMKKMGWSEVVNDYRSLYNDVLKEK